MVHPGYMLNPGDMFSVDQDQVLFATGAPKRSLKEMKEAEEAEKPAEEEEGKEEGKEEGSGGWGEEVKENEWGIKVTDPTEPKDAEGHLGFDGGSGPQETETERKKREARENLKALEKDPNNVIDMSKPYATPWRPRDYMSPFAFIPRYLEVCGGRLPGVWAFFILRMI